MKGSAKKSRLSQVQYDPEPTDSLQDLCRPLGDRDAPDADP